MAQQDGSTKAVTDQSATAESKRAFIKAKDGNTYVLSQELLDAFSLKDHVLVTIGNRSFAIPEVVLKQQPIEDENRDAINKVLDKQELPGSDGEELWNLVPYTACFYGAWAGGGDAVAAGDYCESRYPF